MAGEVEERIESTTSDQPNPQNTETSKGSNAEPQIKERLSNYENRLETSDNGTEIFQNPKENTRKIIASLYVWAFFVIIFITLLIGVLNAYSVDDYKDILVTVSGILSGPLGFIVGYYFKASNE